MIYVLKLPVIVCGGFSHKILCFASLCYDFEKRIIMFFFNLMGCDDRLYDVLNVYKTMKDLGSVNLRQLISMVCEVIFVICGYC